ncbi:hypothetical protein [Paraclostridium dentum]|uniref:hypothetical protein n=1 Tax=Paraclostridium dentum TaxID=2662455 RepID=UPI003F3B240F
MKNVMIVSKQGNALALGNGIEGKIAKSATGTFMSNLLVLKEVLTAIPTEPSETVNIFIMDTVQGLVNGAAVEYVKSGKTVSGNALSAEEISAFKEIYQLYAERILNVRFSLVRYIKKDDTALQTLKVNAYNELDKFMASTGTGTTTTIVNDPDKGMRETLDAQIKEALVNKDIAFAKELMSMRKELREPEVVTTSTAPASRQTPKFEASDKETDLDDEIENAMNGTDATKDENEEPLTFESASGSTPRF